MTRREFEELAEDDRRAIHYMLGWLTVLILLGVAVAVYSCIAN
ncbi:MAG TPA: hypothetical protein VF389_11630 [Woeseiaceae bacterium]